MSGPLAGRGRVWRQDEDRRDLPPEVVAILDETTGPGVSSPSLDAAVASSPGPDAPAVRASAHALARLLQLPAELAAPRLLGAAVTHDVDGHQVRVRITEVEAYDQDDPASHTFRGQTRRNAAMFEQGGHLYTYRSHGIHVCANVVCDVAGRGSAVLLRGGVVEVGRAVAVQRRGGRDGDDWLAAGPGRLCAALGIDLDDGGTWLLGDGRLRLEPAPAAAPDPRAPRPVVMVGPRVGVSQAADRPWRWWLAGSGGVSAYRRSPRASR